MDAEDKNCISWKKSITKTFRLWKIGCTIRPLGVDVNYLQILLDGGFVLQQAKEKTQSIGVPDLGIQMIKDFWIPLPPLTEQKRIVEKYHQYTNIIATIS